METKDTIAERVKTLATLFKKSTLEKSTKEYTEMKSSFRKLLTTKYETSKFVVKSKILDSTCTQQNMTYLFKYLIIDNTKNKPILINQTKFDDPFAPPIPEDMLIVDNFCNLNTHRVMLTKFPLFKEQILLVCRDFINQYTHLTIDNMRDIILLINFINGFGLFNGGMKAGASQPRKHLQAIPYSSLPSAMNPIGLFSYAKNDANLIKIKDLNSQDIFNAYLLKNLNNKDNPHVLFKYSPIISDIMKDETRCKEMGEIMLMIYLIGLQWLGIGDENNEKIEKDYSFLLTQEWMFIVLRKENEIYISEKDQLEKKSINLNSLAFLGIIVSRTQDQIDEMSNGDIIKDVISKL